MNSKCFLFLMMLTATANVHCLQENFNEFKRLKISRHSRLQLAPKEAVVYLKRSIVKDRSWEEQIHDLFGPYTLQHEYCTDQQKLCSWIATCLGFSIVAIPYSARSEKNFYPILLGAACFIPAIFKFRKISQDYDHDQNLLIQKCTEAFELTDLERLQKFYDKEQKNNHATFLNKVLERKRWITQAQEKEEKKI